MQAARMSEWKAVRPEPDAPVEIYNLKDDPGESRNLAKDRSDITRRLEEILRTAHQDPHPQKDPGVDYWSA
jgi:arylsulfatase A-like enzyme